MMKQVQIPIHTIRLKTGEYFAYCIDRNGAVYTFTARTEAEADRQAVDAVVESARRDGYTCSVSRV